MALAANYFIMSKANLFTFLLAIFFFSSSCHGLTKNFVNSSMPDMRPTLVVNFDMATVICQHSDNPEDLHLHEISILCDGKNDCFNNPAMDDESFPYCEGKCNSTCNNRGACLYDGEKAQCYCNSGYHGQSCEIIDKNECQDKPCHWLAKCTNTINSTKCDCFPGFKGNGFECTDVDECAENLSHCPEYSHCVNLPGTFFCNCTSGFMPKSALMPTCIDIDECSTDLHNCGENELCQNTLGSYECVKECSRGYQINGTVCDDIDECLESHRCDKRATCENTNGGYKCICDEGFAGDGHSCSPITDCSKNENICHRHGFCIASLKMCICETGYAGDGLACHDINECETSENPCKDQSDNKCVNIEGGYICCDSKLNDQECIEEKGAYCSGGCGLHAVCMNQTCTCVDGFEGDPKIKCNDVNECEDESFCPGVGQWCVNMIGGHICCGRDSTHPECKGLEINAFNGNFGKGSISNAQLSEARSRGFFTHIIEKGERQENSSGGVVVVVRGNESDASGEAISSNGITFSFEIPTCNDNQNTTICPSNSECKLGRCMCVDGFEWSRSSGSCIDLTAIPSSSPSNEIITSSGEKGLEISVIKTPFKQGSSTEIPNSGEMGLEISGKSTTSESKPETTNFAETSTSINLPETEIENPESGEHLTQEEIERIKKLKANETSTTSTTTILLNTINPASTQSPSLTTTEDMSKVKSGEMGLELSGVSTPSSAEEFTSEPATAISSTTENEKAPSTKTSDFTSEATTSASTTETDTSGEKSNTEVTTPAGPASSTPFDEKTPAKISPRSNESSFEKVPKSGEVGLEIGGSDLSGNTETTLVPTSPEIESTTSSSGDLTVSATTVAPTTEKTSTDVSNESTVQPTSVSPEATTTNEEKTTVGSLSSASTPNEGSTTQEVETSPSTKASETTTETATKSNETEQQSTTPSSATKSAETSPETTNEASSSAEENTTISVITSSSPDTVTSPSTKASETTTETATNSNETEQQSTTPFSATKSAETSPETTNEASSSAEENTTISAITSSSPDTVTSQSTKVSETTTDTATESNEKEQQSTTPSSLTKSTETSPETTNEASSSVEETTTFSAITSSSPDAVTTSSTESEVSTTVSTTVSSTQTISPEVTTIKDITTEGTPELPSNITEEISETAINTTPTILTSPATVQSEISTTLSRTSEEKGSTTSNEMGLELTGKGFTSPALASTTNSEASSEKLTTEVQSTTSSETAATTPLAATGKTEASASTESTSAETEASTTIITSSSTETPTTAVASTPELPVTELTSVSTEISSPATSQTTETAESGNTTLESTTLPSSEETEQTSTAAVEKNASTASTSAITQTFGSTESSSLATVENTQTSFVPDKIITDATNSVTDGSLNTSTSASATTEFSETTISKAQTTENLSTETESATSTVVAQTSESTATAKSDISSTPSSLETTAISSTSENTKESVTTFTTSTQVPDASSESLATSLKNEVVTTTFEPTYATKETSAVFTITEVSITDTLPTSETETTFVTTDTGVTEKVLTTTSAEERKPEYTSSETVGDFTTGNPSSTTSELLPPVIIVDKSRSHEEVDENSQLRPTSTTQAVTDSTEAETSTFATISKTKCLSNDECDNDSYCERRSGVCRCKPGFEGEPPQRPCQDIDECKQNLDDCHSSSRCLNYNGGYHCVCAIGYRKNVKGICEDVDECALSNGTICDSHAVCRNLPGAYLCECNAGYTGDGYNCISIEKRHCNQNEWAKSDCGRNHFCLVNGNGKIDCDVCKNGFVMKNGICSDVNECEENSKLCHSDAICQNIMGGYQCRCQPGYAGDGHNCQDVDECGIQNSCHSQATCVNTPGSFMCECPEGWTGDGKNACLNPADQKCSKRSEVCLNGRENSACLSLKVGDKFESTCECLPNYRYNSTTLTCDDIDECAENRDNCDTANTVCVNTVGGFQCHCAAGYEGNGGICVDIDECKRGLAGCHVNAHCINRIGGVECRCGAGYTGDGTDCFPLDNRQIGGSDCSEDWVNMCRSQNKTCHIDDEEVPQCGSCMFGYQPMDGKCQPINALGNCADPAKNDCDANAECIDVRPGRHFCSCKIGFIGDGMHCDDVDECSIPRLCDFHAVCKNTNGSYECQCKEGFIGNGFKCVPANQSQNCRISPEICHTNAGCQPDGTCKCLRGYEGDGVTDCNRSSVTDGFDEGDTTTSRRPYFTTESFFTSTVTDRHCSARDRTACHVLATCDLDLSECVCRQGFMGDGYIACTRIWEDCTTDNSMCHTNATCDDETKQCQCNLGYIGDGVSCVPDKMDCIVRSNICSEMAECVARRCVCGPGFTGDGSVCMPVEPPQFIAGNCSLCHIQAICANGGCQCGQGCFGNGALCVPDPEDCLNYPGVCHMNGYCDVSSRRCSCRKGFSGNGLDCSKRISCTTDSSICHKDATCLSDGRCECNHGLMGDGVECLKPLTAAEIFGTSAPQLIHFECPSSCGSNAECINGACKCSPGYITDENSVCTDIDECKMQTAQCHPHAQCFNQEGTYECQCLAGYNGNGKECSSVVQDNPDGLKVECKDDGLNVVLIEETSSFNGRIFVRGQSENPYCTKTFNGSEALPLSFHVPIAHCDMQLEENDTLAVTVIIQKHPFFITEQAYAYRLKCTYPTATRNIMSHYNISEITTAETINTKGVEPACQLTVTNERNVTVDSAIVGQVLKLALFVLPNDSFTVLPRNCYAINLETSQRYTLTDEAGCAIDAQLFPEWTRINPSLTHAIFRTFKWPDSSMIRFECDCSACVTECPEINCEKRREEQKTKMRFARDEGAIGKSESQDALWLKNGQTVTKPAAAYSAVVVVMDDAEEQMAQKQVEDWLYKGSLHESEFFSNLDEDRICVSAPWAVICLFSIILSISLLLTMTQIYKRRISKQKHELQNHASIYNDNNSAYIKF